MLNPVAMSIITNTFTNKTERARAIVVMLGSLSYAIIEGPALGWRAPAR